MTGFPLETLQMSKVLIQSVELGCSEEVLTLVATIADIMISYEVL